MSLRVMSFYEPNQLPTSCVICGRGTAGRFSPPIRHILMDGEESLGDVCERCAYGSVDLWRLALLEHAVRLETRAAVLRDLASRVSDGEPAPEGIVEDLLRQNINQSRPRPNLPPFQGPFDR